MYKSKIFCSTFGQQNSITADEKFNRWVQEHPDIKIEQFKYQHARYGDHSICILYTEEESK